MDLILLVLVLCLVGFVIYFLTTKIPMPPYWAQVIQIVATIILILFVLSRFFALPNILPR